jgi:cyanate lyase
MRKNTLIQMINAAIENKVAQSKKAKEIRRGHISKRLENEMTFIRAAQAERDRMQREEQQQALTRESNAWDETIRTLQEIDRNYDLDR